MFKLRCEFPRLKWRRASVPQRLLDEGRINNLLLVVFGILRVSLINFPTQCPGVEATGNQDLCSKYDMFYEATDVCVLTMICLTRLGNLTRLTMPQQIEDDL